ncbi:hypothetical protein L9F63_004413, partial [Diploptera punctata]
VQHASALVAMLEKRRYGPGFPTSPLLATILTAAMCLSLWRLSSCPGNQNAQLVAPSYLLLLPGNATSLPPPYPMHKLSPDDRNTLIDVKNFDFQLNNFPCNGSNPLLLLVLVHSAPGNVGKRRTIRETWGQGSSSHRVLFLLGEVDSPDVQAALEEENRTYRDLVQGRFLDSYRNMTYKHVMALKWTTYFCQGARYLLKTDDDVFVNSPALLDFLAQDLSPWGARRLILCEPFSFAYVKRSYRSKWRVSPLEYPGKTYPAYCAGWAVLYSPDVVFMLYREAQRGEYFWIDDVHVTGTLAARANLTQTPLGSLVLSPDQVQNLVGDQRQRI